MRFQHHTRKWSRQNALDNVISKVSKIASEKKFNAQNLISFYHLRHFLYKDSSLNQLFENLPKNFPKNEENDKKIAIHLPYCRSKIQFEEDIKALIGQPTEKVNEILDQKRKKIQGFDEIKENKYPAYFMNCLTVDTFTFAVIFLR